MVQLLRRAVTVILVIGLYYRCDWTIAVLTTWTTIAIEGIAAGVMAHEHRLKELSANFDTMRNYLEERRRRSA